MDGIIINFLNKQGTIVSMQIMSDCGDSYNCNITDATKIVKDITDKIDATGAKTADEVVAILTDGSYEYDKVSTDEVVYYDGEAYAAGTREFDKYDGGVYEDDDAQFLIYLDKKKFFYRVDLGYDCVQDIRDEYGNAHKTTVCNKKLDWAQLNDIINEGMDFYIVIEGNRRCYGVKFDFEY